MSQVQRKGHEFDEHDWTSDRDDVMELSDDEESKNNIAFILLPLLNGQDLAKWITMVGQYFEMLQTKPDKKVSLATIVCKNELPIGYGC